MPTPSDTQIEDAPQEQPDGSTPTIEAPTGDNASPPAPEPATGESEPASEREPEPETVVMNEEIEQTITGPQFVAAMRSKYGYELLVAFMAERANAGDTANKPSVWESQLARFARKPLR